MVILVTVHSFLMLHPRTDAHQFTVGCIIIWYRLTSINKVSFMNAAGSDAQNKLHKHKTHLLHTSSWVSAVCCTCTSIYVPTPMYLYVWILCKCKIQLQDSENTISLSDGLWDKYFYGINYKKLGAARALVWSNRTVQLYCSDTNTDAWKDDVTEACLLGEKIQAEETTTWERDKKTCQNWASWDQEASRPHGDERRWSLFMLDKGQPEIAWDGWNTSR